MVKKIVSHLPPRHLDDWLAISLLLTKYPEAQVEYVHPQQVPENYKNDPSIILVDVGGIFEPRFKNYDHHQDLNLPSSLILVLCNEFSYTPSDIALPFILAIDLIDRKGLKYASEVYKIEPSAKIDKYRKIILLSEPNDTAGYFLISLIESTEPSYITYDEFIVALYTILDKKGLLEEAKKKFEEEKKEFERKIKNLVVLDFTTDLGMLKVGLSKESLAPHHFEVFKKFNLDLIIERNKLNPQHTSIIKNTAKEISKKIDLAKLKNYYPVVFLHPTCFICVIDKPPEDLNIKEILGILTYKNV